MSLTWSETPRTGFVANYSDTAKNFAKCKNELRETLKNFEVFLFLFSINDSYQQVRAGMSVKQTGKTLIRLLLLKKSDLGLPCMSRLLCQSLHLLFEILEHLP